jgi:hypothetical protein
MGWIIVLAIMLAVPLASQPAEAHDPRFGIQHLPPLTAGKLVHRQHGFEFHHRGFGKPRHFRSPRHFGHFGHGGLVLKFSDGDFVLKFGHGPRFKHHRLGHRHPHRGVFLKFGSPRFGARHRAPGNFHHLPRSGIGWDDGVLGAAPPEVILEQLEDWGFRHVPSLLREPGHRRANLHELR